MPWMDEPELRNYSNLEDYKRDWHRWERHCSESRHQRWIDDCLYKKARWGKVSKQKSKTVNYKRKKENLKMGIFDKFNTAFTDEDRKAVEEAKNTSLETPSGHYIAKIESMEIGATKGDNPGRPMFKVQMRLIEGDGEKEQEYMSHFKNKKPCVFMNRVLAGTKNDAAMIGSFEGWMANLELETPIVFTGNFDDLAEDVLDAMEEIEGLEFGIDYDPNAFNSIKITDIFE